MVRTAVRWQMCSCRDRGRAWASGRDGRRGDLHRQQAGGLAATGTMPLVWAGTITTDQSIHQSSAKMDLARKRIVHFLR